MLIKFFARGIGRGESPVNYAINLLDSKKQLRIPPPEILFGEPKQTIDLINCLDFKYKYRSGVVSFAPEDSPKICQQEALIDNFNKLAFAGLAADRYDILWVRHSHTSGGRIELHFITPRVELSSQKSLNIAPPGWESYFNPICARWNYTQGWARPSDPKRSRSRSEPKEKTNKNNSDKIQIDFKSDYFSDPHKIIPQLDRIIEENYLRRCEYNRSRYGDGQSINKTSNFTGAYSI